MTRTTNMLCQLVALLYCACIVTQGTVITGRQARILGGVPVKDNKEFPYIISIQKNGNHLCGGTILNKNSVVTAAHCVAKESGLRIMAVSTTLGHTHDAQFADVAKIIVHPGYHPQDSSHHHGHEGLTSNDIAVLKLKDSLKFGPNVKCIEVADEKLLSQAIEKREQAKIQGWGATEDSIVPRYLQEVEVQIWTDEECTNNIPASCHSEFDKQEHFCTGPAKPSDKFKGAAIRDDGGPLVIKKKLGGIILHGKHEHHGQCHESTIYTKISNFGDFLKEAAGPEECKGADSFSS